MSVVQRTIRFALASAILLVAGCDDGDGEDTRVTACRKVCDSLEMCVASTDLAECHARCGDQKHRSAPYYEAKAQCASDGTLSCDEWAHELDRRGEDTCTGPNCRLRECVSSRLRRVELSAEQKQQCDALANKLALCPPTRDASALSRTCQRNRVELSPEYFEDIKGCVELQCQEIEDCLDDLAFSYGTELMLF